MMDSARILIVDDDEINRDTLESLIQSFGHTAIVSGNGPHALDLIRRQPPPDMVLLDILMPEMDGYEVLKQIMRDKSLSSIPVIMITVVDEIESAARCIEMGAADYLIKPFNVTLLKARIKACLEKKYLSDQERRYNLQITESYNNLKKAEHIRDALFHMIVHDLNNPLMIIHGYAELSLRYVNEDHLNLGKLTNALQNIDIAAQQISGLLERILDVSRLETGNMPVKIIKVDATKLLREIYGQFLPEVEKRNGNIFWTTAADNIFCHADQDLLSRILQNLISNALVHTALEIKPEIHLAVSRQGNQIIFSVTDNGPGIPSEFKHNIFEKFFRIEEITDKKKAGLGLGLTFCKMAVEAQKGSISVKSKLGNGARFEVILDAADGETI